MENYNTFRKKVGENLLGLCLGSGLTSRENSPWAGALMSGAPPKLSVAL